MIIIRKGKATDFEDYYKLKLELDKGLEKNYPKINKQFESKTKNQKQILEKGFKKSIRSPSSFILLGFINKKLVGYIEGSTQENKDSIHKHSKWGMIEDMVVTKKYQGKGFSTLFKKEFTKWLKSQNIKFVTLFCDPRNKKAMKVYKKWGFSTHREWMIAKLK
jgi:RimJ/RimL family protein N-acetyltransferase